MLKIVMPTGSSFGWGICGKMVAYEMSKLTAIQFYTQNFTAPVVGDPIIFNSLKPHVIALEENDHDKSTEASGAILQAITGNDLNIWGPKLPAERLCGYTFFENNILPQIAIENARQFEVIATGSSWCRDVLQRYGIENCTPVFQGIDTQNFKSYKGQKHDFHDKFVVFSGGKFEFRKGHDLVIAAVKRLMEKFADVVFINAWHNHWPETMTSILQSPHIKAGPCRGTVQEIIQSILAENGIDLQRVITLPLMANSAMAGIYQNTDIGIFPNRCEGGTNLVLMEYLACGKPAIASYSSGHKDIINESNSLPIKNGHPIDIKHNGKLLARWEEPDLDELIFLLEYAYENRQKTKTLGFQAAADMAQFTWERTARSFLNLLQK